jgi:hypothetical protein
VKLISKWRPGRRQTPVTRFDSDDSWTRLGQTGAQKFVSRRCAESADHTDFRGGVAQDETNETLFIRADDKA